MSYDSWRTRVNVREIPGYHASVLGVLERALGRIADERHWANGMSAAAEDGESVSATHPKAVRWCATGAIEAEVMRGVDDDLAYRRSHSLLIQDASSLVRTACIEQESGAVRGWDVPTYNDNLGHGFITKAFRLAIKKFKGLDPLAVVRRKEAARKGWATRRARMAAQAGLAAPVFGSTGGITGTSPVAGTRKEEARVPA